MRSGLVATVKILVDTHVFLWWESAPEHLSATGLAILTDLQNTILLSIASIWEIQIKISLGKLALTEMLPVVVERQIGINQVQILPIALDHIYALSQLPDHHRDPFDRLLIAQAMRESVPILTADSAYTQYPVSTIW
jgi:PIN domain nuclease of toxin-antitoxin system